MSDKPTCPERISPNGSFWSRACGKTAAHEHEGVMYCKTHHPPTANAKRGARNAAWRAKFDKECEALAWRNRLLREANEAHKSTGLTPKELEQQIKQLREALQLAITQNEHDMLMTSDELRIARAALSAAERKTT